MMVSRRSQGGWLRGLAIVVLSVAMALALAPASAASEFRCPKFGVLKTLARTSNMALAWMHAR